MLFIDFEGVFDNIKIHAMWTALKNIGVIFNFYQDADYSVLFKGTKSNKFQIDRGIR